MVVALRAPADLAESIRSAQAELRRSLSELPEKYLPIALQVVDRGGGLLDPTTIAALSKPESDPEKEQGRLRAEAAWRRWAESYLDITNTLLERRNAADY